ncbi:hypothetical protein [Polymorphospora rubra]|uniref:Uncharacterized protein n=1 Tax=Polymorphospora rubra TaxID=338584 RepID=A0A810MWZ5_9ACTN|nr:hypothetical protein [Polymorphospora rubra]BCJ65080.1 hypothetical protein Prubr_21010 [Polymorphospora rubra]
MSAVAAVTAGVVTDGITPLAASTPARRLIRARSARPGHVLISRGATTDEVNYRWPVVAVYEFDDRDGKPLVVIYGIFFDKPGLLRFTPGQLIEVDR